MNKSFTPVQRTRLLCYFITDSENFGGAFHNGKFYSMHLVSTIKINTYSDSYQLSHITKQTSPGFKILIFLVFTFVCRILVTIL